MADVKVYDMSGKELSVMTLTDDIFGITPSESAMHTMVVNYLANRRQGTQSTLTRTEVSGGGKKPWKQKGTGHARQGSTRSPQWTHGGVALGPKPRSYRFSVNRKLKRLAMKSALSVKVAAGQMMVIDGLTMTEYKTKTMVSMLSALGLAGKKAMVVMPEVNSFVIKSLSNIPGTQSALVNTINVHDILKYDYLLVEKSAAEKISEVYR
ncbi:MAG: 50S ribosomal protein L4 [Ruminococcus sp.]|jgi:large subunit ribosomal protein L4|nr:50S ribosomal protein L4 [Ruminococcus sp.]